MASAANGHQLERMRQVAKPLGDLRPNEQPVDGQTTIDLRNPLVENRRGCSSLAARGQWTKDAEKAAA